MIFSTIYPIRVRRASTKKHRKYREWKADTQAHSSVPAFKSYEEEVGMFHVAPLESNSIYHIYILPRL